MQISRDQIICGSPAFDLRAAFKQLSSGWSASGLAALLKISRVEAEDRLQALLAAGYVEPDFAVKDEQLFRLTIKGGALAGAIALKPISRTRADELLAAVIESAKQINGDRGQLYRVSRLWVFGSYLADVKVLGDVDIAVELFRKDEEWSPVPHGEYDFVQAFPPPKSWGRGVVETLAWPQEWALRKLRGRHPHISLHLSTDQVLESAKSREVFSA